MDASGALSEALHAVYPQKVWDKTPKFHKMLEHVDSVPAAVGCWEIVNTNAFEAKNKAEKDLALKNTNRKELDRQILAKEVDLIASRCGTPPPPPPPPTQVYLP